MDYYERGLKELKQLCLGTDWEDEFLNLEARLKANLYRERWFGLNPQLQSERNQIIAELNRLAKERYKISFNDLCGDDLVNTYIKDGDALFREGHYDEARKVYERARQISPDNLLLYQKTMFLYQKMSARFLDLGQWNDVINICNDAISLIGHAEEPAIVAQIYANKGEALFKMRQFDDALKAFDKATEKQPGNAGLWQPIIVQIYEEKVKDLLKENKLQEAQSVLDIALQIQSNNFKLFWQKGIIFTKQENIDETRNAYIRAIILKPDNAFLHKAYGDALLILSKTFEDALLKLNFLEEAFEEYSRAIALKQDFSNAYKRRSEVCKAIAQIWYQKAKEDEERF
jgi:tetratricopeptide (TPR) repeat protein